MRHSALGVDDVYKTMNSEATKTTKTRVGMRKTVVYYDWGYTSHIFYIHIVLHMRGEIVTDLTRRKVHK